MYLLMTLFIVNDIINPVKGITPFTEPSTMI